MKKTIHAFYVLLLSLFLFSCSKGVYCTISFDLDLNGEEYIQKAAVVEKGTVLVVEEEIDLSGFRAEKWYLDEERTIELEEGYVVKNDITIYASLVSQYKVTYINYDGSQEIYWVDHGKCAKEIILVDDEMEFLGWYDRTFNDKFDFSKNITENTLLYAKWDAEEFNVTYDLGFEVYASKDILYSAFFTDFYDFLKNNTDCDLVSLGVNNCEEFLTVCADWNAYGRDSFYGVGDTFSKYYVTTEIGGKLEDQPATTFIGYCIRNNKYVEFIPHLIEFFAYWRTDEGYTGGSDDPNNLGNDFFAEPWASLVDTCKFFKFTSENLNQTYPWFTSSRVKNALDNIPSVVDYELDTVGSKIDPVELKYYLVREGYEFVCWLDEDGNEVTSVNEEMTLYAKWNKK